MMLRNRLVWWAHNVAGRTRRFLGARGFVVRAQDTQPSEEDVQSGECVAVLTNGTPKWVVLACPCGCHDVLRLNLIAVRSPCWSLVVDSLGRPSLAPSVWRHDGCRSHFWIRRGEVAPCDEHTAAIIARHQKSGARNSKEAT